MKAATKIKEDFGGKRAKENQAVDEVEENMQSLNLCGSWHSVCYFWLLILVSADT